MGIVYCCNCDYHVIVADCIVDNDNDTTYKMFIFIFNIITLIYVNKSMLLCLII